MSEAMLCQLHQRHAVNVWEKREGLKNALKGLETYGRREYRVVEPAFLLLPLPPVLLLQIL